MILNYEAQSICVGQGYVAACGSGGDLSVYSMEKQEVNHVTSVYVIDSNC